MTFRKDRPPRPRRREGTAHEERMLMPLGHDQDVVVEVLGHHVPR